jgi:hypothetical protein
LRRAAFLLSLALGGCASSWTFVEAREHPALVPDAKLAFFERGRGAQHERSVRLRAGGEDVSATSIDAAMRFARPIDSEAAAIAWSSLVRELGVADAGASGTVVRPDATLADFGANGRYSRGDADAWGVPFEPTARPYAGGFEVSLVVLRPPVKHPVLPGSTPWRLVRVRELVSRDGTIRLLEEKTLTNGQDAARFAVY